jgi:hypothetical protein
MNDLSIEFKLDRIHCHDEGDGPGKAEPYLWTVFFKVDGDTVVINSDGADAPFLQGVPTVTGTPGNHGNLGTTDVDEDDDVTVPAIIGEYRTVMTPITLTTPFLGVSEVGGMIGCIAVLMEEDNTSDSAVARGHEALDRSVRDKLAEVLGTLSISKSEPSEEDIAALTDQIGNAVKSAIGDGVSVLAWIAGLGNMDDQIGSGVFRFSHKQLEESGGASIPFSRRWDNEGDWELFGHIKATPIRRPDSKCCEELRRKIEKLERALAEQGKRIGRLELLASLAQQAKGSDTVKEVAAKKIRKAERS